MDSVATTGLRCWSRLGFRHAGRNQCLAILLHLSRDAVRAANVSELAQSRGVEADMRDFDFQSFEPSFERGFGYNGALCPAQEQGTWTTIALELGKQTRPTAAVASLRLMFKLFSAFPETRIPVGRKTQLFSVTTGVSVEQGAYFGGEASLEFAMWVLRRPSSGFDSVVRAMREAAQAMSGLASDGQYFRAQVPGGGYQLLVQDGGTGLWLDAERIPEGGYRMDAHNIRSPREALIFLAGLAALETSFEETTRK